MQLSVILLSTLVLLVAGGFAFFIRQKGKSKSADAELNNYKSIIDQANDAMLVIDIVDGRIHQSNPSAARLLGYSEQELGRKSLFDLHPPQYLEKSSGIVADVWEKGGLIYEDVPFVTKSGAVVPVECSAKVAPFAGRPAIVIYARDITERLRMQRELEDQRALIDEKSKDIADSIDYSRRIQRSILVEKEKLKEYAPESFIFFKPREVVSGDFYWFTQLDTSGGLADQMHPFYKGSNKVLMVAAADCTGHGVPGAFMSIIGNTLIQQTLNFPVNWSAAGALDLVDTGLKNSLNRNKEDRPLRDGMDVALCCIDFENLKLQYAGANNPIYVVRNKELHLIEADKQPITASRESVAKAFVNNEFVLEKNDCVYLFTDGYADQFGGPNEKKFMYKRLKETMVAMSHKTMDEQKSMLYHTFMDWKGKLSQVDDVLVIGIKVI